MCHDDVDLSEVTLIRPRRFSKRFVSRFADVVSAIWSNAGLAHELTVWQKQRHEHARAGAAWVGGNAVRRGGLA
jgi:hypothetical protein